MAGDNIVSDLKLSTAIGDFQGDLAIENGDLVVLSDADAAQQFLRQRLRMFFGEWFLDTGKGVPYFQEILKKQPNAVAVDSILKTTILETPGVIELLRFNFDYDAPTRSLTLDFAALLSSGVIEFNEEIAP